MKFGWNMWTCPLLMFPGYGSDFWGYTDD